MFDAVSPSRSGRTFPRTGRALSRNDLYHAHPKLPSCDALFWLPSVRIHAVDAFINWASRRIPEESPGIGRHRDFIVNEVMTYSRQALKTETRELMPGALEEAAVVKA